MLRFRQQMYKNETLVETDNAPKSMFIPTSTFHDSRVLLRVIAELVVFEEQQLVTWSILLANQLLIHRVLNALTYQMHAIHPR